MGLRRLATLAVLAASMACSSGCATLRKVDDVASKAKEYLAQTDAKVQEIRTWTEERIREAEARRSQIEAITGAWDADGDGKVTAEEARQVVVELAKRAVTDRDARDALFDWETFAVLLASVLGVLGAGKAAPKALRRLHLAGRRLANGEGGGGSAPR